MAVDLQSGRSKSSQIPKNASNDEMTRFVTFLVVYFVLDVDLVQSQAAGTSPSLFLYPP